MTDFNQPAARARARGQAHAPRGQRAARARKIRRRVISGAVALFVAAWLTITLVLVSGHDPALAKRASATSSVSTATSTPSTTTATATADDDSSTDTTSDGSATSSSGSGASASGAGVSSVTTSQS